MRVARPAAIATRSSTPPQAVGWSPKGPGPRAGPADGGPDGRSARTEPSPNAADQQWRVRLDVRAHDEDVARLQRRVVLQRTGDQLPKDLDLTLRAVCRMDLDGAVVLASWRAPVQRVGDGVGPDVMLQPAQERATAGGSPVTRTAGVGEHRFGRAPDPSASVAAPGSRARVSRAGGASTLGAEASSRRRTGPRATSVEEPAHAPARAWAATGGRPAPCHGADQVQVGGVSLVCPKRESRSGSGSAAPPTIAATTSRCRSVGVGAPTSAATRLHSSACQRRSRPAATPRRLGRARTPVVEQTGALSGIRGEQTSHPTGHRPTAVPAHGAVLTV